MYVYQLRKTSAWPVFVLPPFKLNIVCVNTVSSISEATIECSNSSIIGASPILIESWWEHCTSVARVKMYVTNMESSTLGGHHTSILCTKIHITKAKAPHRGIWTSHVKKNTLQTQRTRTLGATWQPEENNLEIERNMINWEDRWKLLKEREARGLVERLCVCVTQYHITGYWRDRKYSRISRFADHLRIFSS